MDDRVLVRNLFSNKDKEFYVMYRMNKRIFSILGFSKFLGEDLRPVGSLDKFGPCLDAFIGGKNLLARFYFLASVV